MHGNQEYQFDKGSCETIDDMKGLKLRVMESNVHIETFKAMGAAPVTMHFQSCSQLLNKEQ